MHLAAFKQRGFMTTHRPWLMLTMSSPILRGSVSTTCNGIVDPSMNALPTPTRQPISSLTSPTSSVDLLEHLVMQLLPKILENDQMPKMFSAMSLKRCDLSTPNL